MLRLIIGDESGGVQNANVPIRWCVDRKTLEELEKKGIMNPHILLVTTANNYEKTRQLAPLGQLIEYVQFQKPGINKIYAAIVWTGSGKYNDLWEKYLKKEDGEYRTDVLNREDNFLDLKNSLDLTEETVQIPSELFAKEPPEWLKNWVNLWFEGGTKDQCHFRKRAVIAFTIQPPLYLLWQILKVLYLTLKIGFCACAAIFFSVLCACREVNFKAIVHPKKYDIEDIWFYIDWPSGSFFDKRWYLIPLTPIYPICVFLALLLYSINSIKKYGYVNIENILLATIVITGASILVLSLIAILTILFPNIAKWLDDSDKKAIEESSKRLYETSQLIICNGNLSTDIKMLPSEKRTIHLWFQDLKAKVCKPMSR